MIWSGLTGNCEWLSDSGSRNTTQNIPRPDGDEFGIRGAFIPRHGYAYVVADYEQLEMRIMAHFSGDPNMQKVIWDGKDIHTGTASLMFGVPYDDIKAAIKRKKLAAQDSSVILSDEEKKYCKFRFNSKEIGFGQHAGRSKTCSKRGNLRASA